MMPGGGDKKEVKAKSLKALEKLGHKNLTLDEYERALQATLHGHTSLNTFFIQAR